MVHKGLQNIKQQLQILVIVIMSLFVISPIKAVFWSSNDNKEFLQHESLRDIARSWDAIDGRENLYTKLREYNYLLHAVKNNDSIGTDTRHAVYYQILYEVITMLTDHHEQLVACKKRFLDSVEIPEATRSIQLQINGVLDLEIDNVQKLLGVLNGALQSDDQIDGGIETTRTSLWGTVVPALCAFGAVLSSFGLVWALLPKAQQQSMSMVETKILIDLLTPHQPASQSAKHNDSKANAAAQVFDPPSANISSQSPARPLMQQQSSNAQTHESPPHILQPVRQQATAQNLNRASQSYDSSSERKQSEPPHVQEDDKMERSAASNDRKWPESQAVQDDLIIKQEQERRLKEEQDRARELAEQQLAIEHEKQLAEQKKAELALLKKKELEKQAEQQHSEKQSESDKPSDKPLDNLLASLSSSSSSAAAVSQRGKSRPSLSRSPSKQLWFDRGPELDKAQDMADRLYSPSTPIVSFAVSMRRQSIEPSPAKKPLIRSSTSIFSSPKKSFGQTPANKEAKPIASPVRAASPQPMPIVSKKAPTKQAKPALMRVGSAPVTYKSSVLITKEPEKDDVKNDGNVGQNQDDDTILSWKRFKQFSYQWKKDYLNKILEDESGKRIKAFFNLTNEYAAEIADPNVRPGDPLVFSKDRSENAEILKLINAIRGKHIDNMRKKAGSPTGDKDKSKTS